jgi:phosphohistidine swiveling domain-containing protein
VTADATPDATPDAEAGAGTQEFPIAFAEPSHAELTWEWDDMHMPHALTPLAGDYATGLAHAFGEPYRRYGEQFGPFPQRWFAAVWHGYVYYAYQRNVPDEERQALYDRILALQRARVPVTHAYWRDELVPELRRLYARMEATPAETASLPELAGRWESAWQALGRAWDIHFDAIAGPYQVMDDLVEAYEAATPGAPAGEAVRLAHGQRHELYDVEVGAERLAAMIAASPALSDALTAGTRSIADLRRLPGGEAFATAFEDFLAEHGHLGQSVDDLTLPSWSEQPGLLLADLAKRAEHVPEAAEARRMRLEREANDLADATRARLADRPDELARFNELVAHARQIGFLTEVHNYWIDRRAQAEMRKVAIRVGRRLVDEGILAEPDDVFYLHHDEIAAVLRQPTDQRGLIAQRRAEHQRQQRITPPKLVGKPPPPPIAVDRFDGVRVESTEAGVLRGTGASAGIARGPARVVLTSSEFERIRPGDIIVCPSSNPSWVPVFTIAGGLVTNTGGVLSHAAVVAREFGLPAVTGVSGATTTIRDGQHLEIDGTAGTVRLL